MEKACFPDKSLGVVYLLYVRLFLMIASSNALADSGDRVNISAVNNDVTFCPEIIANESFLLVYSVFAGLASATYLAGAA